MDPVITAGLISAGTGALFGAGGQIAQNRANRAEAERTRKFALSQTIRGENFAERMRNTQWQAGLADMEAAGVNPALAYSKGPAVSPSVMGGSGGQAAPAGNVGAAGIAGAQAQAGLKLLAEQTREQAAKADIAEASAYEAGERRDFFGGGRFRLGMAGGTDSVQQGRDRLRSRFQAELQQTISQALQTSNMAQISGVGSTVAGGIQEIAPAFQRIMQVSGRGAESVADVVEGLDRLARMRDDAVQQYFGFPKRILLEMRRRLAGNAARNRN